MIQKECVTNIEKALHEMRAERAGLKIFADNKWAESKKMAEDAQTKNDQVHANLRAAELLEAEAGRVHRRAERMFREVQAREDDLRRRMKSFKIECDCKEKEFNLHRQSISESQKSLLQAHERVLEEHKATSEGTLKIELKSASLSTREADIVLKEKALQKREEKREKKFSKRVEEIEQVVTSLEAMFDQVDKLQIKKRTWESREIDLKRQEDSLLEKEHELETQSIRLFEREEELKERLFSVENNVRSSLAANELELEKILDEIGELKKLLDRSGGKSNELNLSSKNTLKQKMRLPSYQDGDVNNGVKHDLSNRKEHDISNSPLSAPFCWLKRCTDTLMEQKKSNKKRKQADVTTQSRKHDRGKQMTSPE